MSGEIYSLQNFLLLTKSISYLLAVIFLVGFIWYWRFLVGKDENREM